MFNVKKILSYLGPAEGFEAIAAVRPSDWSVQHVPPTIEGVRSVNANSVGLVDASMRTRLDSSTIEMPSLLQMVSTATTGSDHIDIEYLKKNGITVRTLREDREFLRELTPAAEMSWGLVLALACRIPEAAEHVGEGGWVREHFPATMLNKKTLGIVGCGRIGSWVARYGSAFGMKVLGFDPHLQEWPENIEQRTLESLIRSSDVLSIHVHLNSETDGLISRDLLERIKPGAIIINTSRSAVLDESALLDGLKSGQIGGAGLDVLAGEPNIKENPLVEYSRSHRNLVITPHCGGYAPDAVRMVCRRAAEKIFDECKGDIVHQELS